MQPWVNDASKRVTQQYNSPQIKVLYQINDVIASETNHPLQNQIAIQALSLISFKTPYPALHFYSPPIHSTYSLQQEAKLFQCNCSKAGWAPAMSGHIHSHIPGTLRILLKDCLEEIFPRRLKPFEHSLPNGF